MISGEMKKYSLLLFDMVTRSSPFRMSLIELIVTKVESMSLSISNVEQSFVELF